MLPSISCDRAAPTAAVNAATKQPIKIIRFSFIVRSFPRRNHTLAGPYCAVTREEKGRRMSARREATEAQLVLGGDLLGPADRLYSAGGGCQSSTRLPSGSQIHANRP